MILADWCPYFQGFKGNTRQRVWRGKTGVSLNQWIVSAVAQKIGAVETIHDLLNTRAAHSQRGDLTRWLDKTLDVAALSEDAVDS